DAVAAGADRHVGVPYRKGGGEAAGSLRNTSRPMTPPAVNEPCASRFRSYAGRPQVAAPRGKVGESDSPLAVIALSRALAALHQSVARVEAEEAGRWASVLFSRRGSTTTGGPGKPAPRPLAAGNASGAPPARRTGQWSRHFGRCD